MTSLLSLPAELKNIIIENIDPPPVSFINFPPPDLLSLSTTCKIFRALTVPLLFRDITLLNDQKSGSSVLAIAESLHAKHIHNIHYVGVALLGCGSDAYNWNFSPRRPEPLPDGTEPLSGHLPDSVEQVLSQLAVFPCLRRLVIEFRFDRSEHCDKTVLEGSLRNFDWLETEEEVLEIEKNDGFRSLMKQSYTALARNTVTTVKHLELKKLIPRHCSAWGLAGFQSFLRGLSSFTISLREGECNETEERINLTAAYGHFVSLLDENFFRHLSEVKQLRFSATRDGVVGLNGNHGHTPMPLRRHHMPKLAVLELQFVFVNRVLAEFIVAHNQSLKSVSLKDCYSAFGCPSANDALTWGDFSSGVASGNSECLQEFIISPSWFDIKRPQDYGNGRYGWRVVMEINEKRNKKRKELEKEFPGRRFFMYGHIILGLGLVVPKIEDAIERFRCGQDQEGWQRLDQMVHRNRRVD
jgi:hypothetical protein